MKNFALQEDPTSISEILQQKLSNSASHGIPNIVRSNYVSIKIFWSALFLVSFSLCSYLIIKSILEYFEYDVTSKIRLVKEFPVKFPGIRVCNKDPFITNDSIEFLADLIQNNEEQFNLSNFAGDSSNKMEVLNFLLLDDNRNDRLQNFALNQLSLNFENTTNQTITQTITDLTERMIKCEFNMKECLYATYIFDSKSGFCLTFNADEPYLNLSNIGEFFGLELILIVGKSNKYHSLASSYGAVVYINNQTLLDTKF